jgi:hypothetical protein
MHDFTAIDVGIAVVSDFAVCADAGAAEIVTIRQHKNAPNAAAKFADILIVRRESTAGIITPIAARGN